jgi:hypothetical protein
MKEGLLKDIAMALFPLLITGVGYLVMSVINLQEQVKLIQDNDQIARDQLKEDLTDEIHEIDKRVAVLESKQ